MVPVRRFGARFAVRLGFSEIGDPGRPPAYKCGCLYGRPLPLDSPVRLFVFRAVGHSPLPKNESWRPRVKFSAILVLVLRLDFRVSVPPAGLRATGAAAAPPGGAV